MKPLIVFILSLSYLLLPAQERLTSIVNDVQEELIYIQEVDGINYVLKTNPEDELSVFLLNNDFTLTHLYTNTFKGVHTDFFVHLVDEFIYLIDGREPVKYNFVLDLEFRYFLPEGWFPIFWQGQGTRMPYVTTTNADNSDSRIFFLGKNGEIVEEDEDTDCWLVFDDYALKSRYISGNQRVYYVENIDTQQKDTLIFGATYFDFILVNAAQDLVYIDKNDRICKFEGASGNKYCIPSLTYDRSVYDSYSWIDDYLILFHEDEDHISLFNTSDGSQSHFFDYKEFPFFSAISTHAVNIIENKLVVQTSDDVLIVDLISQDMSFYRTYSARWVPNPVIDDRYILVYDFETGAVSRKSKLIDLKDDLIIDLNFDGQIWMTDYVNVISVGDDYLGVFWNRDIIQDIAFRISPNNLSFTHVPEIQPTLGQGLPGSTSRLFKLGQDLALVSENIADGDLDHIYAIDGNQVDLVVSEEIYDYYPSGFIELEDKLTYAVERADRWDIYSFDGKSPSLEAEVFIPSSFMGTAGRLENYVITNNNVFSIVESSGFDLRKTLVRSDKLTSTNEEIFELERITFTDPLVTNGEDTYFFTNLNLYHVDESGEISTVLEVTDGGGLVNVILQESGEHIYLFSPDGVFLLDGKEAISLYDKSLDFSLPGLEFSEPRDFIDRPLLLDISLDVENTLLYLDGSEAREVSIGSSVSGVYVQENNFFFIDTRPDINGPRRFLLYDGTNDKLYDLTDFGQGERIINLHELNGNRYVISYERFAEILNIYRMSADFSDAELIFISPYNSFTPDPNFRILDGEGILYTNEFIFQVDEDYQFHELDVTGNALTPEMEIDEDGYIYFIATDEVWGNQLYRIILVGLRVAVEDIESIEVFEVYPNPSSAFLNIPSELKGTYMIFNDMGQLMLQGDASRSKLDISKLSDGTYSLQIIDDRKIFVSRFVKIDK